MDTIADLLIIRQVVASIFVKSIGRVGALVCLILFGGGLAVSAHEVRPAIADVEIRHDTVHIELRLTLEAMLAGIDLDGLDDTDAAPEAATYDRLRALAPEDLEAALREAWPRLGRTIALKAGDTTLGSDLIAIAIPQAGDVSLPRDSLLTLEADLPSDGTPVTLGWAVANGPLIVRQAGAGEDAYTGYLTGGATSAPMPRTGIASEAPATVFVRYVALGFEHIVPRGLDHILFVLGLFFLSPHLRPLLIQVTAFTLAHSVTLALASLDIVSVPATIVEPLIAASIVWVAVENIVRSNINRWRVAVVFGFGLLHGLGFASVLIEIGLEPAALVLGLIGFNIGVEAGQLAVIAVAFVGFGLWFRDRSWYRTRIAIPASAVIAMVGATWLLERLIA